VVVIQDNEVCQGKGEVRVGQVGVVAGRQRRAMGIWLDEPIWGSYCMRRAKRREEAAIQKEGSLTKYQLAVGV